MEKYTLHKETTAESFTQLSTSFMMQGLNEVEKRVEVLKYLGIQSAVLSLNDLNRIYDDILIKAKNGERIRVITIIE